MANSPPIEIRKTDIRTLRIIHLDDHQLFVSGMRKAILSGYPNAIIEDFPSNDKALSRLKEYLHLNEKLDLIVTDYNHPGANGLVFTQEVKFLGEKYDVRIPIIMVSMVSQKDALPEGLENSPLDGYLAKASSAEDILDLIKTLISPVFSKVKYPKF